MLSLLKKHYLAIFLAIVVGSLTLFPQLLAVREVPDFQGIYKTVNNDETYYLARARDIIDGHSFLANPYIYEYKNGQPMQFWLPDYLLAKPLGLFNIDLHHGYLFYDFFLPFILTILTYSIIFLLTKSRFWAICGAGWLHLSMFLGLFNRAPSPQLNHIFWLLLFLIWLLFLKRPNYSYALLMGLSFGLLFYIYPYYWTFYVVFFVLFLCLNFLLKRKCDYKKYFLAIIIALIISLPYFISLFKAMQLPYYGESLARLGMIETHFPSGIKILVWGGLVLLLFLVTYYKRIIKINPKSILIFSSLLAPMIVVNQHIITGKNLQFSSHYWPLSAFCFIFALAYLLNLWSKKIKVQPIKILIFILISVYIFYEPAVHLINTAKGEALHYSQEEIAQQKYALIFKWLNENTLPDEVVFAGKISSLIPVYTANNVFSGGYLFFMPDKEVQERAVLSHYWDDFFNKESENYVSYERLIKGNYYITLSGHLKQRNKLRSWFGLAPVKYEEIPREEIDEFLELARDIQGQDFETQIKKYRVDYFIWDKKNVSHWPVEKLEFLEPLYEANDIVIYKIN